MSGRSNILSKLLYTSLYTFLAVAFFALTLLTPGDLIYQSWTSRRIANIFAITGVYIVTLLLVILVYASRIFTTRSVLAGIPKAWIPVEKPDVGKRVRDLVVESLRRSAIIAQQARPRDRSGEENNISDQNIIVPLDSPPPWGDTSHPGWTPPSCDDLPNQEFEPVVKELPHLIEAKAVSLAPADPRFVSLDTGRDVPEETEYVPDERVVKHLQRPSSMCLRDYIGHLNGLGLINPAKLGDDFLTLYEKSRFSPHPLTEAEFRSMMGTFAEMLRGMTSLDPELIENAQMEEFYDGAGLFDGRSDLSLDSSPSFISVGRRGLFRSSSFSSSGKASFRILGSANRSRTSIRSPYDDIDPHVP